MRPMFALRTRMSDGLIWVYVRQMPCIWQLPGGSMRACLHSIGAWRPPPANSELPARSRQQTEPRTRKEMASRQRPVESYNATQDFLRIATEHTIFMQM